MSDRGARDPVTTARRPFSLEVRRPPDGSALLILSGECDLHNQAQVAEVAGMLTPVPGGTGPMTNVMLMENLLSAARQAVLAAA